MNDQAKIEQPDPEWDAERERFEKSIADQFYGRADQQGWINAKGRLNAAGQRAGLEFVIGMAAALQMVDHPHKQWLLSQCFLVSVRGFEDRFPREEKKVA